VKTAFHHTASKQLKFPSTQNARFHQLTEMYTAFNRFESPLIILFGIHDKNLSMSMNECVNRFSKLKNLQHVIRDKWHDVDVRQPESEKP